MFRILVVEDDPDINAAICASMAMNDFDAVAALTAGGALTEIERRRPDILLLDQMLPDMDGRDLCRNLRSSARTARLPIIFLTARAETQDRVQGLGLGADDYLPKPFSMEELILRVRALLRRTVDGPTVDMPTAWLEARDRFRVWNKYSKVHLARGEWRDCDELCRAMLSRCGDALTSAERWLIYRRLARCAEGLGNYDDARAWHERAEGLTGTSRGAPVP